jgi:tRNA dimethylallyltransferase
VRLAKKHNGEVISADSRQVYKGLDIGSGKITKKEMDGIPHHLLDVASPKRVYTAAHFRRDAEKAIRGILKRGKLPIIVGGTGFYIDTLLHDRALPDVKPNAMLRATWEKLSADALFSRLQAKDPARAKTIDRHNKRRLIRALEIIQETGKPVPQLSQSTPYDVRKIGIALPPATLKRRIHARLVARMKKGMVREVERLRENGVSWKRLDDLGLEYRYVSRYLRGEMTKAHMLQKLEAEIWQYARRQMTWFKRDPKIRWIDSRGASLPQ